jgi:hypothetical protein
MRPLVRFQLAPQLFEHVRASAVPQGIGLIAIACHKRAISKLAPPHAGRELRSRMARRLMMTVGILWLACVVLIVGWVLLTPASAATLPSWCVTHHIDP